MSSHSPDVVDLLSAWLVERARRGISGDLLFGGIGGHRPLHVITQAGWRDKMTIHGFQGFFSTHAHESGLWSVDDQLRWPPIISGVRGVYNKAMLLDERTVNDLVRGRDKPMACHRSRRINGSMRRVNRRTTVTRHTVVFCFYRFEGSQNGCLLSVRPDEGVRAGLATMGKVAKRPCLMRWRKICWPYGSGREIDSIAADCRRN